MSHALDAPTPSVVTKLQMPALIIGGLGAAAGAVGAFLDFQGFLQSYLVAFSFWNGITLGMMSILMIQYLSGGGWGIIVRRSMEAGTRNVWLMLVLFLPLLAGAALNKLYIWTDAATLAKDHHLQHKVPYLNIKFFVIRFLFYFVVWLTFSILLNRWSLQQDQSADKKLARNLRNLSGPGLLIMGLTLTFSNIDWLMSLQPHWFSSMYPLINIVGNLLSAMCFVVPLVAVMSDYPPFKGLIQTRHFRDLGNLMLAFVLLWTYTSISQLLITYSGNLPEETPWYLNRFNGGWGYVATLLLICHFVLPFFILLQRKVKDPGKPLMLVGIFIITMRLIDLFWWVKPSFNGGQGMGVIEKLSVFNVSWLDFVLPVAMGGIWVWFYLGQLKKRPLVPLHDPNMKEAFANGGH